VPFPSDLPFTSFLQYAPQGVSAISRYSRGFTRALKDGAAYPTRAGQQQVIPYVAAKLAESIPQHNALGDCFRGGVIVVPAPRSAPLLAGALWPAHRLCSSLVTLGVARSVGPLLMRKVAVSKSATAGKGQRPGPEEHYASISIDETERRLFDLGARIVIVDDVVTRGATFLGCFARLRETFPSTDISCFAFVRTMSGAEIDDMIAPVFGVISYRHRKFHRFP
jgi:hypothetical protein